MKNYLKLLRNNKAMTMTELLAAVLLILPLSAGVMLTIVNCMQYADTAVNYRQALAAAQNRMIQMENTPFNQVLNTFNSSSYTYGPLNGRGMGISYVIEVNPGLLQITSVFCWRDKNGRVYGEDLNLNGALDTGEDANLNDRIDSIASLTTSRNNF